MVVERKLDFVGMGTGDLPYCDQKKDPEKRKEESIGAGGD